jgi:hypothetical protein
MNHNSIPLASDFFNSLLAEAALDLNRAFRFLGFI